MQGRGWVWETQQRVSQRDPPSWNLPAIGVFSPSEFSEHTVSHPRVCFGHVPITTVHIFSHLIYFKFLKGRRNYALFALMIFFFFALLGAGLSNLSFPDNFSLCRHLRSSWWVKHFLFKNMKIISLHHLLFEKNIWGKGRLGSCLKAANPLRVNVTFIAIKYFSLSVRHLVPIIYSIGYLSSPAILHTKQCACKSPLTSASTNVHHAVLHIYRKSFYHPLPSYQYAAEVILFLYTLKTKLPTPEEPRTLKQRSLCFMSLYGPTAYNLVLKSIKHRNLKSIFPNNIDPEMRNTIWNVC